MTCLIKCATGLPLPIINGRSNLSAKVWPKPSIAKLNEYPT